MTSAMRWCASVFIFGLMGLGCVESAEPDLNGDDDLCAKAAAHLSACMGQPMPVEPGCDLEAAEGVLAQRCQILKAPGKADFISNWLCGLGFMYLCPMPACEPSQETLEAWTAESCSDLIGEQGCDACNYYLCREQTRGEACGADGYLLGFVRRYCVLFTEKTSPRLSSLGQQWIDDVRPCLQMALEELPDSASCQETRDYGYASHPGCYVGTGFCELPVSDMLSILLTVAPQDLGTQPFTTGLACVKRWFNPDTFEPTEEGRAAMAAERLMGAL